MRAALVLHGGVAAQPFHGMMGRVTEEELARLADRLIEVPGVQAVTLGGSRARGDHAPESDYDMGL